MRIRPDSFVFSEKLVFRLVRHLGLIISLNLIFIWIATTRDDGDAAFIKVAALVLFNSFFFFSYAYITAYVLFPVFLLKRKILWFGLSFLLTGLTISSLKFLFSDYLFYDAIADDFSYRLMNIDAVQVITNTKDMTFIVAIFLIAKFAKDNYNMGNKLRELQEKRLESEIKLIHNQLDPHVIFNNLNNLYSISLNNSDQLLPNIQKLRSLLNYYFAESKNPQVALQKELDMIDDFMGLEKLRYGDRLDLKYNITGPSEGRYIVPFVLFSFVENCFEHGCSIETGQSWIKIDVDIRRNSIHFYVENSKPNVLVLREKGEPESSMDNMRKKLELLYPGRHYLVIKDENLTYSVALKLKIA
jgi:hypothetical protein